MIVTIFKNRLRADNVKEYGQWIAQMRDIAVTMPGYISHKTFTADDGERVTLVEFESEETLRGWARQPDHVAAKKKGRDDFYSHYDVMICNVIRQSKWERDGQGMQSSVPAAS